MISGARAAGLVLAAAVLITAMATAPAEPSFDESAVYARRVSLVNTPSANPERLYDVLEDVPGAKRVVPLPVRPLRRHTIDAAALEAARAYAARTNSNALLVWRDGAVELEAYFNGYGRESGIMSRSLSKPLAAFAVGRAIALGKIASLDEPVADFVTEWRDPYKGQILVRHLLDMRSGLLAQGPVTDPASIWARSYLGTRHDEVIIREYPLTDSPGTRYNYSNATADLVAPLIERATGRRFAEFVSTELFQPLGSPGGKLWLNRPGGTAHSGCCLLAPAEVWLRLAILWLDDGMWQGRRLLPAGYAAQMATPTKEYPYAALGMFVAGRYIERRGAFNPDLPNPKALHSEPYLARDLVLFDGNAHQVVYIVPSLRLIVVRTGEEPPRSPEWDNAFLPNTIIGGLKLRSGESLPEPQPR